MEQIDYNKLDYDHKLLYVRSVFQEAKSAHSVYERLYTLLSGNRKIEEKHLDMLYVQITSVVDSLETDLIVERMGKLAAQLEHIQKMEKIDRERELQEINDMEKAIMMIDDDKPVQLGRRD